MSGLLSSNSSSIALSSCATKLNPPPQLLNFSPDFVGWCTNCDNPFHHFEPLRCAFIYQQTQSQVETETKARVIIGFYCPNCDEALAQAQPNFATNQAGEIDPAIVGTATEWHYPTDEELEDAVEWTMARG